MQINWSTRELDVFLALGQTLSFRRTADQVHLSQSAVSGVLTRLEESLGTRLFDRTTRSVQLTLAGQVFFEQVKVLRAQTDEAVRAVRSVAELQVGQVTLAALPSLAATVVPAAMARLAAQHPGIRLSVIDTLSGPAFDLVRRGEVDFALTAANPAYADLDDQPLASDGFVLLLPAQHALAKGRQALGWAEVADLVHISMPQPTSVRQYADAALLEHRLRFSPRYEVEHLATPAALVPHLEHAGAPGRAHVQLLDLPPHAAAARQVDQLFARQIAPDGASSTPLGQAMIRRTDQPVGLGAQDLGVELAQITARRQGEVPPSLAQQRGRP